MNKIKAQFVGEFGHELFAFQAKLRQLSKTNHIEVICFEGHEYLYDDFALKIGSIKKPNNYEPDCWQDKSKFNYGNRDFKIKPNSRLVDAFNPNEVKNQDFIRFGRPVFEDIDIVVHVRDTNKTDSGHYNWSKDNWDMLLYRMSKIGLNVACIGTSSMSYKPPYCKSYIDEDLETVCNVISSANWIIGESSGPMHLASLCGTNQIVWSENIRTKKRYEEYWNPFNTEVHHFSTFNPEIQKIIDII